ncbi:hypothetical protein ACFY2W_11000 [Streptomyces sp. NPDC001262]|uniref:hypothetical protein n=1 Tax=Streptomyces TaxID=1883 RepID=UPI0036B72CE2
MTRFALPRNRTRIAALGAALLIATAAAGTAVASDDAGGRHNRPQREAASLTGTGKLYRSAGDDIHFTFDAHLDAKDQMAPDKAHGTFRFSHYLHGKGASAEGRIDCLVTGGKVAVATGVITKSDLDGSVGKRVGFTVDDRGRHGDRLGYSWAATGSPRDTNDLPKCVSSAPFEKVESGDFTVVPWEPKL